MRVSRYEIVVCRRDGEDLTVEEMARRSGVHPGLIEKYVEYGLIEAKGWEGERKVFDAAAMVRLRMIGRLRAALGMNVAGIAVTLELVEKLTDLIRENEALRGRL
jgi:DNA-binding transcriptional MerR regulator